MAWVGSVSCQRELLSYERRRSVRFPYRGWRAKGPSLLRGWGQEGDGQMLLSIGHKRLGRGGGSFIKQRSGRVVVVVVMQCKCSR